MIDLNTTVKKKRNSSEYFGPLYINKLFIEFLVHSETSSLSTSVDEDSVTISRSPKVSRHVEPPTEFDSKPNADTLNGNFDANAAVATTPSAKIFAKLKKRLPDLYESIDELDELDDSFTNSTLSSIQHEDPTVTEIE